MAKSPVYYNVAPRFSGGSPAQVDFETATKVADDERAGYDRAMHGVYGSGYCVLAQEKGLAGIVEERTEKADCWLVTDMLTGNQFIRMFPQDVPEGATTLTEFRKFHNKVDRLEAKYRLKVNRRI